MTDKEKLIREFTAKYQARITMGLATYGEFDPATDTRCLSREAIEECLDIGSYMEMCEHKTPALASKCRRIVAKAIVLYGLLKELEQDELTLTRRERG